MIQALFNGDWLGALMQIFVCGFIVVAILPLHEFSHAFAAHKMGDDTAKWNGRLTLNPKKHIDPVGAILLVLVGFGWAKPVPVNPNNFKKRKAATIITAAAGPLSNLIAAFIMVILYRIVYQISGMGITQTGWIVWQLVDLFVNFFVSVNITLAIFNLIPIPPLDGSRIFGALLPYKASRFLEQNQMLFSIGLLILIASPALNVPLFYLRSWVFQGMWTLADLPFRLFGG